jgi:hypothetical protein
MHMAFSGGATKEREERKATRGHNKGNVQPSSLVQSVLSCSPNKATTANPERKRERERERGTSSFFSLSRVFLTDLAGLEREIW